MKSGRCCKTFGRNKKSRHCLNPFEVREVLQEVNALLTIKSIGLNPFEVREVLQVKTYGKPYYLWCLNPFEVREVLQEEEQESMLYKRVSIPLKSGRCCKINHPSRNIRRSLNPFEVREVLQVQTFTIKGVACVSIPLKSGRCCKRITTMRKTFLTSQSL